MTNAQRTSILKGGVGELLMSAEEFTRIIEVLSEDVRAAASSSRSGDQRETRNFVRAVFAYFEGATYRLKQLAYSAQKVFRTGLTPGEIAMLLEQTYVVNDSGEVNHIGARIAFLSNVRFAFRAVGKVCGSQYQLPVGEAGWERLRAAVKVRDRLMHPKNAAELDVSTAEREVVKQGYDYLRVELLKVLDLLMSKLKSERDKAKPSRKGV